MPTKFIKRLGRTLDARPDRLDLRDRAYLPPVATLPEFFPNDADIKAYVPAYVKAGLILDQLDDGACTGFGLACVIHYLLWRRDVANGVIGSRGGSKGRGIERVSTRMLYHLARFYDEWPGEDYEGSSCRGALKAWHKHGVCTEKLWPYFNAKGKSVFMKPSDGWDVDAFQRRIGVYMRVNHRSVVDMQAAIKEVGAIYVSADAHDGWDDLKGKSPLNGHASLPVIRPIKKRDSLGGHAFALVGYNPTGFVVQNSWGKSWGLSGFGVLPFEDWVQNGTDAWACALGVPGMPGEASKSVLLPSAPDSRPEKSGAPATTAEASLAARAAAAAATGKPEPTAPWTIDQAYLHTVVLGNEGRPISRLVTEKDGAASITALVNTAPAQWFASQSGPRRLAIYAHGGLNAEAASLKRIQVLAPYFKANNIYPVFITWKTGVLESAIDILEDAAKQLPRPEKGIGDFFKRVAERVAEVLDRTIEVAARPAVKPIWSQMKENAGAANQKGFGLSLIAEQLAALAKQAGPVELHIVGHSAGSILLGYLLDRAPEHGLTIKSCSLYAPACTALFALDHYKAAVDANVLRQDDIHLHLLSDKRELDDTVGPYQKSLLYLVSRALESAHKTPILGMQKVFDPSKDAITDWNDDEQQNVKNWQAWWTKSLDVLDAPQVRTGPGTFTKAAHGCFDNDIDTITTTLKRILRTKTLTHAVESLNY